MANMGTVQVLEARFHNAIDKDSIMTAKAIPDEALFFVADRYYSRNDILTFLYTNPSSATAEHFNAVNIHIYLSVGS